MAELTREQLDAARAAGASESDLLKIQELRRKAAEFEDARQWLLEVGPIVQRSGDTELMVEYGRLLNRADFIKNKVQAALDAIRSAIRWAQEKLGLRGSNMSSLGVVWFIPLAVIGTALAVIGYWLSDFYKFRRRFMAQAELAERLKAEGVSPIEAERQAAAIVADAAGGWLRDAGKVAAAGVAVFFGVMLFRSLRRSR